jgi:hypothetical protein
MSLTKKESRELEMLRRENETLRTQIAGQIPSPIFFRAGDRVHGPQFYLPAHEPVYFGGISIRLEADHETVVVYADDMLTIFPQASNSAKLHAKVRFRK